ncbi:MAG TPA: hypothetical protein PLB89_06465 [Flavobacteriales bacterium]|nr:hypothetical protein [Flavobacteriales bacterium]
MLPKHFYTVLATLGLIPAHTAAQTPSLTTINDAFAGKITFKIDRHQRLVADFFDDGNRFRQDIAPLVELDPDGVSFSPEEDAVVLKCLSEKGQCFTKEIFKLDVVRLTGRSTLPRPADDAGGERTMADLRDLIRTSQAQLVQVTRETPNDGSRMNTR